MTVRPAVGIDLYDAGRKHWVGDADFTLDLEAIERATESSRNESIGEIEIVESYDDPACNLVLPLQRKRAATDKNSRMAA